MRPISIRSLSIPALLAGVLALGAGALPAAEHPEHPKEGSHEGEAPPAVAPKDIGDAIRAFVEKDSALKGGFLLVYDKEAKAPLVLTLDKVHEDKLASIGGGIHFACCDFKTPEGKAYDLDFFLRGDDPKALQVTEITVHKEDGKPRYDWKEEGGVWKREEAKPEGSGEAPKDPPKGPEHPEHPK